MAVTGTAVESTLLERMRYLARIPSTFLTAQLQANLDVAERVIEASGTEAAITDSALLDSIRVYLGAHFCTIAMGGDTSEMTIRGTTQKFVKEEMSGGLRSTEYGRTAMMLDWSGKLSIFSKNAEKSRIKPRLDYIGTGVDEHLDNEDYS